MGFNTGLLIGGLAVAAIGLGLYVALDLTEDESPSTAGEGPPATSFAES